MLEKIFFFFFLIFIGILLYFYDSDQRYKTKNYHLCQDVLTKEWLVPLTDYQYKILRNTYIDFSSMYFCQEKQYTKYHVDLMRIKKP